MKDEELKTLKDLVERENPGTCGGVCEVTLRQEAIKRYKYFKKLMHSEFCDCSECVFNRGRCYEIKENFNLVLGELK